MKHESVADALARVTVAVAYLVYRLALSRLPAREVDCLLDRWRGELEELEGAAQPRRHMCEDCDKEVRLDAHHDDYYKPMDVRWLCRSCHREHHAKQTRKVL